MERNEQSKSRKFEGETRKAKKAKLTNKIKVRKIYGERLYPLDSKFLLFAGKFLHKTLGVSEVSVKARWVEVGDVLIEIDETDDIVTNVTLHIQRLLII